MKRFSCLFLLLAFMSALSACSGQSQGATSIVNSPCNLPCWQNITPGVTRAEKLNDLLKAVPDIEESRIVRLPKWDKFDEIYDYGFKDNKSKGSIFITEGVVNNIVMIGDLNITLEKLIMLYGEPEKLIVGSAMTPGLFGGDGIVLEIYMVYSQKGFAFSFYNPNIDLISIKPNILVKKAIFSVPENIVNIVSPSEQSLEELERQERAFDWKGYQELKFNPQKK